MARRKKIRFYYHNHSFLKLGADSAKTEGPLAWTASRLFTICYLVGLGVYRTACWVLQKAKSEWKKTLASLKLRAGNYKKTRPALNLALFLIALLLPLGIIQLSLVAADALETKDKVMKLTTEGLKQLQQAKDSLAGQNYSGANNSFRLAHKSFETGKAELSQLGGQLGGLANLTPQKKQAELVIRLAAETARTGGEFSTLAQLTAQIKMTPGGLAANGDMDFSEILDRAEASVSKIDLGISKITGDLDKLDLDSLPGNYRSSLSGKLAELKNLSENFSNFKNLFQIFKQLFRNETKILVLMQNNNELRPAGGFIGSFAELEIKSGNFKKINVDSIYALDGQLKEKIAPPQPLLGVNQRWYMRDANWFADFTESAKKVSAFYEKEGGETPDAIIAITPNIIRDMLKITGPVEMPKYQVALTAENFVELTQIASSDYALSPENKPKQILADLVPVLFSRLSEIDGEHKHLLMESLQKNLSEKQVLLYSRNSGLQKLFDSFGWTGRVLETDRDYLAIIGANLGGTKSDLYIDQEAKLITSIGSDGSIVNRLTITRKNRLPNLDKTFNESFIRILVPKGSKLLENQGFDFKVLETPKPGSLKTDEDALRWEKSAVKDLVTGMTIGEESGKTFFGNWQRLEGGQSREISIAYQLPFKLSDVDRYSLLLQKQPGVSSMPFTHEISFKGRNLEWSSNPLQKHSSGSNTQKYLLSGDLVAGSVLIKQ